MSRQPTMAASETDPPTAVHVRWMIRRDMPEILAIENASFEFPWTEEDFIRCLQRRNCIGMIAERQERIVGYMLCELFKTRLELLDFAVAVDCRRQGVGRRMVAKLLDKIAAPYRRHRIRAEVRERNLGAQLFFRASGFRATGVVYSRYEVSPEDAIVFELRLARAVDVCDQVDRYLVKHGPSSLKAIVDALDLPWNQVDQALTRLGVKQSRETGLFGY